MTAEKRLDALVDSLRRAEPALDDLTRARVGAELQAVLREPRVDADSGASSRRGAVLIGVGVAGLAAAAAALAVAVATGALGSSGKGARTVTGGAPGTGAAPGSAAPGIGAPGADEAAPTARVLAPGTTIGVVAGAAERVAVEGAEVTVYGPGRLSASLGDVVTVVDADAALIDRARGDGALALAYGDLEVRVTRATFALDRTVVPRVTVMRGEIVLRCAVGEQTVRAGESATCASASDVAAVGPSTPLPLRLRSGSASLRTNGDFTNGDFTNEDFVTRAPAGAARAPIDEYAEADAAMRRGDHPAARVALEALIAAHPDDNTAAAALLDLARLDAAVDPAAARRRLDALDAHPHGAVLAEPAAHLRCTLVAAATDRAGRIACLASYYRRFPDAPRAAAALARLAVLHAETDCAAAAPLLDAYLARFPDGADRAAVVAWRDRCFRSP